MVVVSDHAAFDAKAALTTHLVSKGHDVVDLGTDGLASVDYPDFAAKGGHAVASGVAPFGVFLCGSGIGIMMAANKVDGVRAALVYDEFSAEMSRRHNDANVACLGGRVLAHERIARLVDLFLATPFDGGRHTARVAKLAAIEREETKGRADSTSSIVTATAAAPRTSC